MDAKDQLLLDRQLSLIFTKGPVILPNAKFSSFPKIKVKRKISIGPKIYDSNKCKGNIKIRNNFSSRLELEQTLKTHLTIPQVNLNALPVTKPEPLTGLIKPRKNLLQCSYCKSYKRSQNELTIHERIHTREQPFQCKHCSKRFTWEVSCRRHEMIDCEFKCIPENETNTTVNILTSKESSATATRIKQNQIGPGKNQEKIVNKGTRRLSRKPVRYNYSSDSDVLSCDSDDDSWKGAQGHPAQGFSCFYCKKVFSQKANLKVHERTHTGEQPYFCTNCNARFKQLSGLNYHVNQSKKSSCSKIANK